MDVWRIKKATFEMLKIWVHQPIKSNIHCVVVMSEMIASYFVMHVEQLIINKEKRLIVEGATYRSQLLMLLETFIGSYS